MKYIHLMLYVLELLNLLKIIKIQNDICIYIYW